MSFDLVPLPIKNEFFSWLDKESLFNASQVSSDWSRLSSSALDKIKLIELKQFCIPFGIKVEKNSDASTIFKIIFDRFSRNRFGYKHTGLQGPNGKKLASLTIPPSLRSAFAQRLEWFIYDFLKFKSSIELRGEGQKINPLFLATLLKVVSHEAKKKTIVLEISRFDMDDCQAKAIAELMKTLPVSKTHFA